MRIGIVCYPTYGGSGAVATELGLALAQRGHEVHFVSYAQPFRLRGFSERVTFHEVKIGAYPLFEHPPYSLALAVMLHQVTVKERLDVIHAHYAIPHATSAIEARQLLGGKQSVAVVTNQPWMLLPAVMVIIAVLAFNLAGDGLRDAADPYGH